MKHSVESGSARGLASLRDFVRKPAVQAQERCDLCANNLAEEHQHLFDPRTHRLICACDACAILFSSHGETNYRRVPRDSRYFTNFSLSDPAWNSLAIPIGLAFIYRMEGRSEAAAVYPSPAGPTESMLDAESWEMITSENPALARMLPDVEALLVNRMNGARDYFCAPIDQCYKLTGLVRKYWRGFHGGEEGWAQIGKFFDDLKRRSYPEAAHSYARSVV